jgi:pantoate--beta-alanine ligase
MRIVSSVADMAAASSRMRRDGRSIGLVPTMGFLHDGHLSLVRAARRAADAVVVSIFVNPTQFGPNEDFARYPRDLARDAALLEGESVDILFHPEAADMYPEGFKTFIEVHDLQNKLCGASRPGHFRGVCTVVLKLFEIVRPDIAVFGQKDAQQAIILRRMARDLNLGVNVDVRPIVREKDGLALSSRNTYLSPAERRAALVLSRSLKGAEDKIAAGEKRADVLRTGIKAVLELEPLARVDYVAIVDPVALDPVSEVGPGTLIALAAYFGKTRLIDNILVGPKE